jgi:hypothetical protein
MTPSRTLDGTTFEFQGGDHSGPLFPGDTRQRTNVTMVWLRVGDTPWRMAGRSTHRARCVIEDSQDEAEAWMWLEHDKLIEPIATTQ